MQWFEMYDGSCEPSSEDVLGFVDTALWDELVQYAVDAFKARPVLEYSKCKMDDGLFLGWNLKLKKSGKNLCTLYPKQGYYLALITVAAKDTDEADIMAQDFCPSTKELYDKVETHAHYGKMLCLEVRSAEVLGDLKRLVALRATTGKR